MKIIHCADIHLGRRRLDGRLPDRDFADAFHHIATVAIQEKAGLVLLAGDLFDRPQVEPHHLRQAQEVLSLLKAAAIPVIAIEGNHDKAFINSSEPTWLNYLAEDDLLILLTTRFNGEGPIFIPWDILTKAGSWIELEGIRFVGAGYLGAATPHKVRQIVKQLEAGQTHVMLLHAGPDYFVGEGGGFSTEDLQQIHDKVSYLALGHIHKPMLHGGWACNPGSPENCDLQESRFDVDHAGNAVSRGYALVELTSASKGLPDALSLRSNPRRPCVRLTLDCTPFGTKTRDGMGALEKAATQLLQKQPTPIPPNAVVEIRLTGVVNLDRLALDLGQIALNLEKTTGILAVAIDASGINAAAANQGPGGEEQQMTREEVERASIRELVSDDSVWGLEGDYEKIATLFFDLKESVRLGKSGEELNEQISTSPLVEKIRLAKLTPVPVVAPAPEMAQEEVLPV